MTVRRPLMAFVACLLLLGLSGCGALGVRDTPPERLERYVGPDSRFLELAGSRVHVRDEGEGEVIVLLHGALASLHTWDGWVEELVADYRVIRLDLPPFGLSSAHPQGRYDGPAAVELLNALLERLGIESAVLVGNSLGGYYAAYFAAHAPERVRALTLISPAGYPQQMPIFLRLAAAPGLGKLTEWFTPRAAIRRVLARLYAEPDRVQEQTVTRYFDLTRAPGNRPEARVVVRQMAQQRDEEPVWVRRIVQPTLLLWGEQDHWVPLELAERWLSDLKDSRLLVYPDAGHIAMEEIAERTVRDFRDFLESLE
jgi:pimeloyl-ACP methyl ester carboxylesterase